MQLREATEILPNAATNSANEIHSRKSEPFSLKEMNNRMRRHCKDTMTIVHRKNIDLSHSRAVIVDEEINASAKGVGQDRVLE